MEFSLLAWLEIYFGRNFCLLSSVGYFEGRFIIFLSGHTHYDGMTITDSSYMLRPGSQTFSDAFGEKCNFPLNNISTQIIGLPKGGPTTGPGVFITLSYEDLYCYSMFGYIISILVYVTWILPYSLYN